MDMNNNPPANNPMNNQYLQIQNNLNRVAHQLQIIITNNYMNQNDVNNVLNTFNLIQLSINNINVINNIINNQQQLIDHIINNNNNP